jgi:hypothetical protein
VELHGIGPPPGEGDPLELSFPGGNEIQANIPKQGAAQAQIEHNPRAVMAMPSATAGRRHLHLVPPPPPPRPRRIDVRISADDGRSPIGRSRAFRLTHDDLDELIAFATRIERRA